MAAGFTEPAVTDDTGVCGEDKWINGNGIMELGEILYRHNVVDEGVQMYKRHKWREDIVTPYVVTYAIPLRMRTHAYTIIKQIEPAFTGSHISTTICEEFSMRNG